MHYSTISKLTPLKIKWFYFVIYSHLHSHFGACVAFFVVISEVIFGPTLVISLSFVSSVIIVGSAAGDAHGRSQWQLYRI